MCALLDNEKAKCWGTNSNDILGTGDGISYGSAEGQMGDQLPTIKLGSMQSVTSLAQSADDASCAINSDGDMKCWGRNAECRLGIGLQDGWTVGTIAAELGDNLPFQMGSALPFVPL